MLQIFVDSAKCNGCGKCSRVCPKGPKIWGFEEREKSKVAVVREPTFCLRCMLCVAVCQPAAISVKQH